MSKKDKKKAHKSDLQATETSAPIISKRGWKVIGGGIAAVILGYIVLSMTDPMGQNWAGTLSPLLLVGGYATIGIGIITKDPLK